MLLAERPQVKVEKPKPSPELMVYCEKPFTLSESDYIKSDDPANVAETKLRKALNINAFNHELYAKCYLKQRDLVDAVRLIYSLPE